MRANFLTGSSNTGGTGALTLQDVTGLPGYENFFAGTRLVEYTILEFTTSAQTVLKQAESGIGSFVNSTKVLTRTTIEQSWDGTTLLPNWSSGTAPSAVTFGSTAANIQVICAPVVASAWAEWPYTSTLGDNIGVCQVGVSAVATDIVTLANQQAIYVPCIFPARQAQFTKMSLRIGATGYVGGSSSIIGALYEIGSNGRPGKKLVDWPTTFGALAANTTLTSAAATAFPNPGPCYAAILTQFSGGAGAPQIAAISPIGPSPLGMTMSGTLYINNYATVASVTTLDDPATLTSIAVVSSSASPAVMLS